MASKCCFVSGAVFTEQTAQEKLEELQKLARERKENDSQYNKLSKKEKVIYTIAKHIAETDSIGEGYSYHNQDYSVEEFKYKFCEYRAVAELIYNKIKRI